MSSVSVHGVDSLVSQIGEKGTPKFREASFCVRCGKPAGEEDMPMDTARSEREEWLSMGKTLDFGI